MLLQAYRGVSAEYPENTYPALLAAAEQDYPLIEVDVTATADGVPVLMSHTPVSCLAVPLPDARSGEDKPPSIGGSADFGFHTEPFTANPVPDVDAPVFAGDLSYEALLGWDFGALRGGKHRNTPICTLTEALEFATAHHLGLQLNLHHISGPAYARLIPTLRERRDVSLCFEEAAELRQARRALPQLPLHYRGPQDAEALEALGDIEGLTVWFAPESSDETVHKVRAMLPRAAIAAGPVTDHSQLHRWRTLGAVVVSTAGQLRQTLL